MLNGGTVITLTGRSVRVGEHHGLAGRQGANPGYVRPRRSQDIRRLLQSVSPLRLAGQRYGDAPASQGLRAENHKTVRRVDG